MLFDKLGKRLGRPVGFLPREAADEPMTALATGNMLLGEYAHSLSARLLRALESKMKILRFMSMAMEGQKKELRTLVELCMDRVKRRRGEG